MEKFQRIPPIPPSPCNIAMTLISSDLLSKFRPDRSSWHYNLPHYCLPLFHSTQYNRHSVPKQLIPTLWCHNNQCKSLSCVGTYPILMPCLLLLRYDVPLYIRQQHPIFTRPAPECHNSRYSIINASHASHETNKQMQQINTQVVVPTIYK